MYVPTDLLVQLPSGRSARGSHQLAASSQCERYWWLKYAMRWSPHKDKAWTLRGKLIHLCMQYHYASRMSSPPVWYYTTDMQTSLEEAGIGHPQDVLRAKELLTAYRQEYLQEPWEPFALEEEFEGTVGELDPGGPDSSLDDEVVTCRPDMLVKIIDPVLQSPALEVFDYKTSGKHWEFADGKWRMRGGLEPWKDDGPYALNWQVLLYLNILRLPSNARRLGGLPIKGFWIQRMTREPDNRNRYFFDRHLLKIPVGPYLQTPRLVRAAVAKERHIRQNAEMGIKPQPNFWACDGKFGPCDFRDVCMAPSPEEREHVLKSNFSRD